MYKLFTKIITKCMESKFAFVNPINNLASERGMELSTTYKTINCIDSENDGIPKTTRTTIHRFLKGFCRH